MDSVKKPKTGIYFLTPDKILDFIKVHRNRYRCQVDTRSGRFYRPRDPIHAVHHGSRHGAHARQALRDRG